MVTRPYLAEVTLKDMWLFLVAIMLVMLVVGQGGTPAHSARAEQVDDGAISAKVRRALLKEVGINSMRVGVETAGGQVVLTGRVRNEADRIKAEAVARSVDGVTAVDNKLDVR